MHLWRRKAKAVVWYSVSTLAECDVSIQQDVLSNLILWGHCRRVSLIQPELTQQWHRAELHSCWSVLVKREREDYMTRQTHNTCGSLSGDRIRQALKGVFSGCSRGWVTRVFAERWVFCHRNWRRLWRNELNSVGRKQHWGWNNIRCGKWNLWQCDNRCEDDDDDDDYRQGYFISRTWCIYELHMHQALVFTLVSSEIN